MVEVVMDVDEVRVEVWPVVAEVWLVVRVPVVV